MTLQKTSRGSTSLCESPIILRRTSPKNTRDGTATLIGRNNPKRKPRQLRSWRSTYSHESEEAEVFTLHHVANLYLQFPEYQLQPLPDTNPRLEGVRWKQYHAALGPTLEHMPQKSWDIVKEEKADDMIHVLEFPYNGEPPRVCQKPEMAEFDPYL